MLQNEISQVFEPPTAECSSKQHTRNHASRQQGQNENRRNSNAPVAEWETEKVFSVIVADLSEMINRYKLTRDLNDNDSLNHDDIKHSNEDLSNIKNVTSDGTFVNGSLTNTNEVDGIHIPEDVLIKELSASQSTLNSTVRLLLNYIKSFLQDCTFNLSNKQQNINIDNVGKNELGLHIR